jgi:hypothetical protein
LERGPLGLVSAVGGCLEEGVAAPVWRTGSTAVGIRRAGHVAPSIRGVATGFADGLRSLGPCGSPADSGHGV